MRSNPSKFSISLVFFLSSFASAISAQDSAVEDALPIEDARLVVPYKLRVATRDVPPFSMRTEDGQWAGISIDLLREVKAELEVESGHEIEIEFQELSLSEMLDAVEDSEIDIAAAAITVN